MEGPSRALLPAALALLDYEQGKARERQVAGVTLVPDGTKVEAPYSRRAATKAGEKLGVSGRSVSRAHRVREADPEVFEKVKAGEMSVRAADEAVRRKAAEAKEPGLSEPAGKVKPANKRWLTGGNGGPGVPWRSTPGWPLGAASTVLLLGLALVAEIAARARALA